MSAHLITDDTGLKARVASVVRVPEASQASRAADLDLGSAPLSMRVTPSRMQPLINAEQHKLSDSPWALM